MEIDDDIYKDNINDIYENKEIYEIYYNKNGDIKYSFGKIKKIDDDNNIEYYISYGCDNYRNPIINLDNNKIIGIKNNMNIGTLIKVPINKFIKESRAYKIKNIENKIFNENNEIIIIYEEKDIKLYKHKIDNFQRDL